MMNNLQEVTCCIKENNNIIIIPHKNPDGDCLGSSTALFKVLRGMGKNVKIALPSPVNDRLSFIWGKEFTVGDFNPDCVICVDVASTAMMGDLYDKIFIKSPLTICIDHHDTNVGYADINYIDASSAATGEIIYDIICELDSDIDSDVAQRILVAIADDTGCFQYSNTTSRTHAIVSELYKKDIDSNGIMKKLYNFHKNSEISILRILLDNMEFCCDSKVCLTHIDYDTVTACGGDFSQTDAWISLLRSIENVEVGMLFKVHTDSEVKVSLRSNDYVDVASVAKYFGGGGHVRAAGVTFYESWISAKEKLVEKLEKLV